MIPPVTPPANKFNLSYTPRDFTPGSIKFFGVEPLDLEGTLGSFVQFNVTFVPGHPIPDDSLIKITFPADLPLVEGSCALIATSFEFDENTVGCFVEGQVLSLKNLVNSQLVRNVNNETGPVPLSLSFSTGGSNPTSTCAKIDSFRVQTFAVAVDGLAIIDDTNFTAQSKNFKPY